MKHYCEDCNNKDMEIKDLERALGDWMRRMKEEMMKVEELNKELKLEIHKSSTYFKEKLKVLKEFDELKEAKVFWDNIIKGHEKIISKQKRQLKKAQEKGVD